MQRAAASAAGNVSTAQASARWSSTATGAIGCCFATCVASGRPRLPLTLLGIEGHESQRGPSRVNGLMRMIGRLVGEADAASRAQAGALLVTHRAERQREHDRVAQLGLEVDEVAFETPNVVVRLVTGGGVQLA